MSSPAWACTSNDASAAAAPAVAIKIAPVSLRTLFVTYYPSIWRLLRRFGVQAAQLDDATQEVFWVAARRLVDIQPDREHSFLYGVALRVASSEVRRQRAAAPVVDLREVPSIADDRPSPEEQLADRQARQLLDDVLNRMPLDLRTVFVLFEIEGLEIRQVAEIEEIPIGTAGSRLRRAREEFSAIAKRVRARLIAQGGCR
jgi:RNA polymerase sigma-70 factor (ECF subfamily)